MTERTVAAVSDLGDISLVIVTDDVDIATAPMFKVALAQALDSHPYALIDLGACRFFDSSGAAVIANGLIRVRQPGWLGVCRASRSVRRTIQLLGLEADLRMFASIEEARRAAAVG